jgi:hypothetical protein
MRSTVYLDVILDIDNVPFSGQAPADGADRSRYMSALYEVDHAAADIAVS